MRAACLGCLLGGAIVLPRAAAADSPAITVSEPAGFSELTREQTLMVDIYFGGMFRGEAEVKVTPGSLTFLDPHAVLALLPDVPPNDVLEALFAGRPFATNSDLACSQGSDQRACGRLSPDSAAIIFDRNRFRVDVFLNPRFLSVHDNAEDRYLPAPQGGLSAVNAIGAALAGQSGPGATFYSLQDRLIVGDGERRLRADLALARNQGLGVDSVAFEWDRPELRYSAGELWGRGNDVSGRRKLIGAGIETQIDTRRDKDEMFGSPVVLYLERRARVDVVRDGRLLSSAIYDAGNQQIDTADMPEGSYDIVLRIDEAGQPTREERRFFTKSRRLPSLGRTDFFAYGGLLVKGMDAGSLSPSGHPYAEAGVSHRLSQHWAFDGALQATDRSAAGELGATFVTPLAQVHAAVVADTSGTVGEIFQLASNGNSRFNFGFDLRRIDSGGGKPGLPGASFGSPYLDQSVTSFTQASGSLSYTMTRLRLAGSGFYRKEPGERAHYSVGPSLEWDVMRSGTFRLTLQGDFAATDRGNAAFAGITLQLFSGRGSLTAQAGGRASTLADDQVGRGAVGSIAGTWETGVAGGMLELGAGYQHQPLQQSAILSSEFRHPFATLAGDFVRSKERGRDAVSQYSLGLQTTVVAAGGGVRVAGKTTTDSMVVARVDGARPGDRFEVLVNETVAGTIDGPHALALALPAYRAYQVRIRPTGGGDLMAYDSSVRTVGLYPGIVSKLSWIASPMTMKFGRLVGPDGNPIEGASITGKGAWSETDAHGDFQIEAPDNALLTVTTREGRSYSITLPPVAAGATIARLGPVECCKVEQVQLGVLDLTPPANTRAKP